MFLGDFSMFLCSHEDEIDILGDLWVKCGLGLHLANGKSRSTFCDTLEARKGTSLYIEIANYLKVDRMSSLMHDLVVFADDEREQEFRI